MRVKASFDKATKLMRELNAEMRQGSGLELL